MLIAGALCLALASAAPGIGAQQEGSATRRSQPYRLSVVLQFSDDPLFTRFYRESTLREVRDQLGNFFGPLAEVRTDTKHPLLDALSATSLGELTISPADSAEGDVVFLFQVAVSDGIYRLQWRQLSLAVQYAGPLRARSTADRQWLAKAICLAVREDFAPVADVEPGPGPGRVRLHYQGGAILANGRPRLEAWLTPATVFQVLWVVRDRAGKLSRMPVPYTLISLDGRDPATGTVISGRSDPFKRSARIAGFEAVRLTTRPGRFRLRLVNSERPSEPVLSGVVFAHGDQFSTDAKDRLPPPDPLGWVAGTALSPLAYVSIRQGERLYQVLLPITTDPSEFEYRIPVDRKAYLKTDWQRRLRYAQQDAQVLLGTATDRHREVSALNDEKRYEEALKRVKAARTQLASAEAAMNSVAVLESEAKELQIGSSSLLAAVRSQVDELGARLQWFAKAETDLAATIQRNDAIARANMLVGLAGQAELNGDAEDALDKYRLALKEDPGREDVVRRIAELERVAAIKDPAHRQAREFILKKLAATRVQDLEAVLPQARDAFAALRRADDYITARKLINVLDASYKELAELASILEGRGAEDDRRECERVLSLADRVSQFRGEVSAWIAGRAAGGQPTGTMPTPAASPENQAPPDKVAAPSRPTDTGNKPAIPSSTPPGAGGAKSPAKPAGPPPDIEGDRTAEPVKK